MEGYGRYYLKINGWYATATIWLNKLNTRSIQVFEKMSIFISACNITEKLIA